jgi:SAM-dependent methyltransferase
VKCRHCQADVGLSFLDLGTAPPSNAYLGTAALSEPEIYYPLRVRVCVHCWLVQTEDYARADALFSQNYAYFSSVSRTWLEHAIQYSQTIIRQLQLTTDSFVIEVAANDGYLLKNFVAAGIPCLGIEPTASTATAAEQLGIPIVQEFFGTDLAERIVTNQRQADLIIGNNVYAHVPDINDFTMALKIALKPGGTITLEFPHLMELLEHTQFDTIYHEHFSYLSLYTVTRIFRSAGLRVWHVEKLETHGGSLRVFGCHIDDARASKSTVESLLKEEEHRGLQDSAVYKIFQSRADMIKLELLAFLIEKKRTGKSVAAYGAAAKGNTLLNYAGVRSDILPFVCDAALAKQGKYLPGSRIPILPPSMLRERRPDYLVVLPWNIADEVSDHCLDLRKLGTKLVIAVPRLREI